MNGKLKWDQGILTLSNASIHTPKVHLSLTGEVQDRGDHRLKGEAIIGIPAFITFLSSNHAFHDLPSISKGSLHLTTEIQSTPTLWSVNTDMRLEELSGTYQQYDLAPLSPLHLNIAGNVKRVSLPRLEEITITQVSFHHELLHIQADGTYTLSNATSPSLALQGSFSPEPLAFAQWIQSAIRVPIDLAISKEQKFKFSFNPYEVMALKGLEESTYSLELLIDSIKCLGMELKSVHMPIELANAKTSLALQATVNSGTAYYA